MSTYNQGMVLQWQYTDLLDKAYEDRKRNGGEFSKEGVRLLNEAAIIQNELKRITKGSAQQNHAMECSRLLSLVKKEMLRLGLINEEEQEKIVAVKPVVNNTAAKPVSQSKSITKTEKTAVDDELGDFDIESYIVKADKLTLSDLGKESDYLRELDNNLNPVDFASLFPMATKNWKERSVQNYLFFGPPGTGKSYMCKAIAGTLHKYYGKDAAFFLISGSEIASKYVAVAGHRIKAIFDAAAKYRFSVVCIDEIETICPDRLLSADKNNYTKDLLEVMDGIKGTSKSMVIACTNYPKLLDNAILSRLQNTLFIDYPSVSDIIGYFSNDPEKMDYFSEEKQPAIDIAAKLAAVACENHYSYRTLNILSHKLRDATVTKTLQKYPEGNPQLTRMIALTWDEVFAVVNTIQPDFNQEVYETYLEFQRRTQN